MYVSCVRCEKVKRKFLILNKKKIGLYVQCVFILRCDSVFLKTFV
jgi:hypothetical protein